MKVWIVTTGEPVPSEYERPHRAGVLSQLLSKRNHIVIWWTTTFDHQRKEYLFDRNTKVKLNENLTRFFLHSETPYYKNISLKRIKNHYQVADSFEYEASKIDKPDLIFCSFPTIDLAFSSVKYGLNNNLPVIVDVRDLWPDIFLHPFPGIIRPLLKLMLNRSFSKTIFALKNASGITAVSDNYLKWGLDYAKRKKTNNDGVFPLGYKREDGYNIDLNNLKFKIEKNKINIWFVGTFGRTYDLSTVIKTAHELDKVDKRIHFIFTGDGENMDKWKKESKGLQNITFTGWVGKKELRYISDRSSIGLMAYSEGAPQGLPNKIFEYMSAGIPILSSLQSETKELISKYKIGLTYAPNNHNELLEKIKRLTKNEKEMVDMGKNTKEIFNKKFDSEIVYNNLAKFLENYKKR